MSRYDVPGARFVPCMDSFLGSAKGVLAAMGEERPFDELWGLSGLAYRTQVHRALSPVGLLPRQWDATYTRVMRRFGFDCSAGLRDSFYTDDDLRILQGGWMDNIEKHLDRGLPAIAFGLHGPSFGIIHGFDDETENYSVSTFLDGRADGPVNAQDLGSKNPPCIFVLMPEGPRADYDRAESAREAFREAVDQHFGRECDEQGRQVLTPPDLAAGPAAYDAWTAAVASRQVQPHWGAAYTAGYYVEARSNGAAFLRRAARGLFAEARGPLEEAAVHLECEAECLTRLAKQFPPAEPHSIDDPARRIEASHALQAAKAEHQAAMAILERFCSNV